MKVTLLEGNDLDYFADGQGFKRYAAEPDSAFRQRLREHIVINGIKIKTNALKIEEHKGTGLEQGPYVQAPQCLVKALSYWNNHELREAPSPHARAALRAQIILKALGRAVDDELAPTRSQALKKAINARKKKARWRMSDDE